MAETTTPEQTGVEVGGLSQLLDTFEDEHHHPKSGLLWFVLLAFTLLEVGVAFVIPTNTDVKPVQFREGGQALAAQIVAEADADTQALKNRHEAHGEAGKFKPDELALTGRPGYRLMKLMTAEERQATRAFANYKPGDPAVAKAELAEKSAALAATLTKILDMKHFFQAEAFRDINIGMAVQAKISSHRRDKTSALMEFLGEASIQQLNRTLLERSYPRYLESPSVSVMLIAGLLLFACLKAFIVGVFFMHGRYEGTWLQILIVPSCTLAMVVIVFLSPDVGMVYHTDWAMYFLLPGACAILVAMFAVLQMTKRPDIPDLEPAEH